MVDTLARMQRAQYEYQQRVRQVEQAKAARLIRRVAKKEAWTIEELVFVLEALGLST